MKNELFKKFSMKKMDFSQNSMLEKQTFHKIQYQKNGLFTKFYTKKTDFLQNSILEKQTLNKILY